VLKAQTPPTQDTLINELHILFDNNAFFRNNEYFGKITEGYTLFGYWAEPKICYKAKEKISVTGGAHLQKYFGLTNYSSTKPYYQIALRSNKTFSLILGNLPIHKKELPEPILSQENEYTSPYHEGLIIAVTTKRIQSINWLEWEDFLFHNEDKQEVLNINSCTKAFLFYRDNIKIATPLIIRVHHQGGQINAEPKKDLVMVVNNATGLELFTTLQRISITSKYLFCGYANKASAKYSDYDNGSGHFASIRIAQKNHKLSYSYWNAFQYVSPDGEQYLNTVSDIPEAPFSTPHRELSTFGYSFETEYAKMANISTGISGIYDNDADSFDYFYWLSISIHIDKNIAFRGNKP